MTKIAGRYEIASKLGEGGMGVVFRAYDPAPMDREVAVKTLHEFSDPLALELFYKECTALKSISHPNIVEIFDMGEYEEDGHKRPFFVMPLLPGESLDQLIRRASHRLTVDRVVEIFAQTCRGLHAAHEHGRYRGPPTFRSSSWPSARLHRRTVSNGSVHRAVSLCIETRCGSFSRD